MNPAPPAARSTPAEDVIGVVLAGGFGRRMGRDKSLVPLAGQPAAQRQAALLREATRRVVVSVRPEQLSGKDRAAFNGLECIADDTPGAGPLGALVTVARHFPERALLIVAVDLAGLTASALRQLLAARAPEVAVVAARQQPAGISSTTSDLPHPLCALWTPPALAAARRAWQAGSRSPRWVLADIACDNPRAIRLLAIPFTDRNTPPRVHDIKVGY